LLVESAQGVVEVWPGRLPPQLCEKVFDLVHYKIPVKGERLIMNRKTDVKT
jgi:hypothetical protein